MEELPDPGVDHIVAEVSKNWGNITPKVDTRYGGPVEGESDCLGARLEQVWLANERRGFEMKDWQFTSVIDSDGKSITETVVALFVRRRGDSFKEELDQLTKGKSGGEPME